MPASTRGLPGQKGRRTGAQEHDYRSGTNLYPRAEDGKGARCHSGRKRHQEPGGLLFPCLSPSLGYPALRFYRGEETGGEGSKETGCGHAPGV